jgi:DNA repair exonuclease SbcCD ATPase subunit
MLKKEDDIVLNCRQCGKDFVFTKAEQEFYEEKGFDLPRRCKECRSTRPTRSNHLTCSKCGTELEEGTSVYCNTCLLNIELESELKTKKMQKAINEAYAKLKAIESENAELEESLYHEEKLVRELEQNVNVLNQDLEKVNQLHSALNRWFQPTLNGIEERLRARLETLESGQKKINERMLQSVQKIYEMYANTTLFEIIKRGLRHHQRQGKQTI